MTVSKRVFEGAIAHIMWMVHIADFIGHVSLENISVHWNATTSLVLGSSLQLLGQILVLSWTHVKRLCITWSKLLLAMLQEASATLVPMESSQRWAVLPRLNAQDPDMHGVFTKRALATTLCWSAMKGIAKPP